MANGTKRRASNTLSSQPLTLPAATIHAFAGSVAPEGWQLCDGAEVSRTTYASLFSAIGTAYGVGDGSTTFNLPDTRGQFLRSLDDMGTAAGAAGVDVDGTARTVGQLQDDALKIHRHTFNDAGGSGDGQYADTGPDFGGIKNPGPVNLEGDSEESRPKNMAVSYIIKL